MKTALVAAIIGTVFLSSCTRTDDFLTEQAKKHSDLIDPESAMFRNLSHSSYLGETWCGEINAKNRLGAYTGWSKFYVSIHKDGDITMNIMDAHSGRNNSKDGVREALRELSDSLYETSCRDAEPASDWVPIWK